MKGKLLIEKMEDYHSGYDNTLISCECDILDNSNLSLLCYDFFTIVYSKDVYKELTLLINYELMDEDFEEEFQEWLYNSERLSKNIEVFGNDILPKKDFYFELINDANERLLMKFNNSILLEKDKNKVKIRVSNIKLVQKF